MCEYVPILHVYFKTLEVLWSMDYLGTYLPTYLWLVSSLERNCEACLQGYMPQ